MHPRITAALRRLQQEKRTGVFRATAPTAEREVYLERGAIVRAHSSSLDERLGEHMVRRGRITARELEDASVLVRGGRRLGDALVELQIVARQEVETFVRTQIAEIASKLLTEPPRKLEFHDESVGKVTSRPVPVADAIIEAARTVADSDDELRNLLDSSLVPELTRESMDVLESLGLQSREAFILSRCDGQGNVRSILAQSPLSEEETARVLLGLEHAGIIRMKGAAATGH